jgi:hypothetical protein
VPKAVGFALAAVTLLTLGGGTVLATNADLLEPSVSVTPSTLAAGGTIVVAGSGLEPMSDRVIEQAGQDLTVELGSVTADAAGAFQAEFAIPLHLPPGAYELRAIGDRILATQLTVTSGVAGASAGQADDEASMVATTLILLAAAGIMLAAGGVVAWRAERRLRVRSS